MTDQGNANAQMGNHKQNIKPRNIRELTSRDQAVVLFPVSQSTAEIK